MSTPSLILHSPPDPPHGYHPVIHLPDVYQVRDFTQSNDPVQCEYSVGKYNEVRPFMYTTPLFSGIRNIHMGIDIGAPIHTPIYSFDEGCVYDFGYREEAGDYGHLIIVEYVDPQGPLWALYGHLSAQSIQELSVGQMIHKGENFAWVGAQNENGGWPPHLHFQLSRVEPTECDLPGVVSQKDHMEALKLYPDPQSVLGRLYPL